MARKLYKMELSDKLAKVLDDMPAKPKSERDVTATEVIQKIDKSIRAMQRKNYTLEEIAVVLSENELPVSVATIKSALARSPNAKKSVGAAQPAASGDKPAARQARPRARAAESAPATAGQTKPENQQTDATGTFEVKGDRTEL